MSEAVENDYNVLVFFVPGNENFDFLKNNFSFDMSADQ